MKFWQKLIIVILCLLGMGTIVFYNINSSPRYSIWEPVYLNIEIDRAYAGSVSIGDGAQVFQLSSEEINPSARHVILHASGGCSPVRALFLRLPIDTADKALNAIDNISIFIGNKLFYFSGADIARLQSIRQDEFLAYELPGIVYKESIIKSYQALNWGGDLNAVVRSASLLFFHPLSLLFLGCILYLFWPAIARAVNNIIAKKEWWVLGIIVLIGFILRLNGYIQDSIWHDEFYSVFRTSAPVLPFMSAFIDSAHPPFYYILLRWWFMIFGWTEQSGRILSVILGAGAVIPMYILVKNIFSKNAAAFAAICMAASAYLIGFQQEMRGYALLILLVPIVIHRFIIIVKNPDLKFWNLIWYIVPAVLLVNTHYYGNILVFANFLFFIARSIAARNFDWNKTSLFFAANVIIACSILPYLIYVFVYPGMWDTGAVKWLFGYFTGTLQWTYILGAVLLGAAAYGVLRKKIARDKQSLVFLDYSVFAAAAVYVMAFGISVLLYPMLYPRYFVILYPLLIAALAVVIANIYAKGPKFVRLLCIAFAFVWISLLHYAKPGGSAANAVFASRYSVCQNYISADALAHHGKKSVELFFQTGYLTKNNEFYGYDNMPPIRGSADPYADIMYYCPIVWWQDFNLGNGLKIHAADGYVIYKIYQTGEK
ncbi:hypothetical protein FACS189421_11760 [Bacteroidia bacterium]|nr:hypothetical protein FACS189421_11760 [Bacteroidia bacterium]